MQTILGAGGVIGSELARELKAFTSEVQLVSRNPKKVNPDDQLMKADLTNTDEVDRAVAGSSVVYLTAGLTYNTKIWRAQWPVIMRNVISSCKKHDAKLVFFDNIYMYDREFLANMTEDTPVRPSSRKGEVREQIASMLLNEISKGQLTAIIARSADFIGPANNILVEMVVKNFAKGKKANWFARADKIHNFTSTTDAARGTAILGNAGDAWNEVWHLPTTDARLTGKDWIELIARQMNRKPAFSTVPAWMFGMLGIFIPLLGEMKEMGYQYDRDYFFNSSKFNTRFSYAPSSPEESVQKMLRDMKQ